MKSENYLARTAQDTMLFGERLARQLKPGDIVCLFGDLGAGKTTLVKGIARGLKINPDKVNSPTYVLLNIYKGQIQMFHFDLYRLEDSSQIAEIGYDEFLYSKNGIAIIEWADRFGPLMPEKYLRVELKYKGTQDRQIKLIKV